MPKLLQGAYIGKAARCPGQMKGIDIPDAQRESGRCHICLIHQYNMHIRLRVPGFLRCVPWYVPCVSCEWVVFCASNGVHLTVGFIIT